VIWVRSNIRAFVRLALFALVVQFVAAFGHMHADDLGLSAPGASGNTHVALQLGPAAPSDQDQHPAPLTPDNCPICATTALIASGIASLPPPLVVPLAVRQISHWVAPAEPARSGIAVAFRSRAPPLS
jgi:Protein of unknown function (DUF2946)